MKIIKDTEVRWGVIGAGDVCEVKSAPAMQVIEGSQLVAVMRRNGDKARDYARRHNVPKWYDDEDSLLEDPEVNAIYIATPPDSHARLTIKAATAGKPVYVEKPMARTYHECREMIYNCENANVPLYVAYYRRALPNFLKVKELIDSGAIGEVRTVNIQLHQPADPGFDTDTENNWRVDPEIAGAGYFYDLASHQLDFLDFLLGPVAQTSGFPVNQAGLYKAEDNVAACFRFSSGITGVGSWCFTTGETAGRDRTTITGSGGRISYPSFDGFFVDLESDHQGRQRFEFEMPKHIQYPLIESIVQELLGKADRACASTGSSGARTNRVMEQILRESDALGGS